MGVPVAPARLGLAAFAAFAALSASASVRAEPRPTEGGLWSFEPSDVVVSWEEPRGVVRVHYSEQGPNATWLDDDDGDGTPDYPQLVAALTSDALVYYAEALSLRPPLPESRVGEVLGGSAAHDVYLVDFGGAADGRFGIDACIPSDPGRCAGFLVIENDFSGYGYASLEQAVRIVASHEAFHAVQAAYADLPTWVSEGTATWATHRFDPTLPDFVNATGGYLADPGRPIYHPPPGPVAGFAYGSALWWEFITTRNDDGLIEQLLVAMDDADGGTDAEILMEGAIVDAGDQLANAWRQFVRYNLAAGFRAGSAPSHDYAATLDPIDAAAEGPTLDVDIARLFPLAARYWRVAHPGGPLAFGADAAFDDAVTFTLHPVAGGAEDGVVGDALEQWGAADAGSRLLQDGTDLPAGGYWIVATLPVIAPNSAQARICIGDPAHVMGCGIDPIPDPDDTTGGEGGDETGETSSGPSLGSDASTADSTTSDGGARGGSNDGCACRASDSPEHTRSWWGLLILGLRNRRGSQP